ncbi:serine/threonine-protein kinase [Dermatobacter hominis]|uniref:serine/threonine-protein kinase n=1 Tax=Dermatobacter hominis TaxID=2884263 RepID=UPI001D104834|nr:serine/threonine-protein kinase [Dermatobacter hominis]UDY34457.1 serine/threonine protein kinase [Dermatobacter hominis]
MEAPDGLVIPGVQLEEVIGRGASSVVYRGTQTRFDRPIAVKVLQLPGQSDLVAKLFLNECRTLGHLTPHPNVVSVFDAGFVESTDGEPSHPFLVMEYLPGGTLADRVAADGPLPVDEVLRIGVQLAGGLHSVHLHDIVHGDIKPQNVLRSRTGEAALADFGIARLASAAGATTRAPLLTPLHAAPELFDGGAMTPRSDVYELCSTLFELLDGDAALGSAHESPLIILGRMARDDRRTLDREVVPAAVAEVIEAGLAPDPSARPASAAVLGEQLQDAQRSLDLPVTPLVVIEPLSTEGAERSAQGPTGAAPDGAAPDGAAADEPGAAAELPGQSAVTLAPPRTRRRPTPVLVAAVVVLVALAGALAVALAVRSDDGADVASAGPDASVEGQTTTSSWPEEVKGTEQAGLQPGTEYDVPEARDMSSVLATRLGEPNELFGRLGAGAVSFIYPSYMVEQLPARIRWQAFNPAHDSGCLGIVSWPLTIEGLWEKGANWPGHQAFVKVIEFGSERDAAEAFSVFSLEQGVTGSECTGFGPNPRPFDHDRIDVQHQAVDLGLPEGVRYNSWIGPPPAGITDVDSVTTAIVQHGDVLVLTAVTSGAQAVPTADLGGFLGEVIRRLDG